MKERNSSLVIASFVRTSPRDTREVQHVSGTNTTKCTSTFKSTERCIVSFLNETNTWVWV